MSDTLIFVKADQELAAILLKLNVNNIKILEGNENYVKVKANCLPIEIRWERCSCHGGRMFFNQDETNIHIELSSDTYDEEKGITDPDTELAYYIDNKMIETIESFEKYIYIVETIGEYQEGKSHIRYYNNIKNVSYDIFQEDNIDPMNTYGEILHQYPNANRRLKINYWSEKDGIIEFKLRELERINPNEDFIVTREYIKKFWIIRKNKQLK